MGYSINLVNSKTNKIVTTKDKEFINLYEMPPTANIAVSYSDLKNGIVTPLNLTEFSFDTTYNYSPLFRECLDNEHGIRILYNKSLDDVIDRIYKAISYILKKYIIVFYKDIYGADPNMKNEFGQFMRASKKPLSVKKMLKCPNINDYWAVTPYNVYKYLTNMLYCLEWVRCSYPKQYKSFILCGD